MDQNQSGNNQIHLPGYEETQELIELYRKVGFTEEEITERLLALERLLQEEIFAGILNSLSEAEKKQFDQFLVNLPSGEEVAKFLKLDSQKIKGQIKGKLRALVDQLKEEVVRSDISLEEIKKEIQDAVTIK